MIHDKVYLHTMHIVIGDKGVSIKSPINNPPMNTVCQTSAGEYATYIGSGKWVMLTKKGGSSKDYEIVGFIGSIT